MRSETIWSWADIWGGGARDDAGGVRRARADASAARLDVIVGTPALNVHVDRDNFNASPDGIANLDLATHLNVIWDHIDRRNASQTGYAGCVNGYCWGGFGLPIQ